VVTCFVAAFYPLLSSHAWKGSAATSITHPGAWGKRASVRLRTRFPGQSSSSTPANSPSYGKFSQSREDLLRPSSEKVFVLRWSKGLALLAETVGTAETSEAYASMDGSLDDNHVPVADRCRAKRHRFRSKADRARRPNRPMFKPRNGNRYWSRTVDVPINLHKVGGSLSLSIQAVADTQPTPSYLAEHQIPTETQAATVVSFGVRCDIVKISATVRWQGWVCAKTSKRTTSHSEMTELYLTVYRHHLSRTTTLDHRCIIIHWW